jgi:hypothetical protein
MIDSIDAAAAKTIAVAKAVPWDEREAKLFFAGADHTKVRHSHELHQLTNLELFSPLLLCCPFATTKKRQGAARCMDFG